MMEFPKLLFFKLIFYPFKQCYAYLRCVAQTFTPNIYSKPSVVGTARMGNATNPGAVVDERLRVRNVRNLRVIDSSVMPLIPNSHTIAPTIMIGEKGVHMLMQDQGLGM